MERVSQLLNRNRSAFEGGEILLFNPPPDQLLLDLTSSRSHLTIWSQDFGDYRWFLNKGVKAGFGVVPGADSLPSQVILFQPREKERLEMLLHFLASNLPANGVLWLAGENQSGIKSAARRLKMYFNMTGKVDAARHCVLFKASQASRTIPFLLPEYEQKWLLENPPAVLRMVSLPGAFAHGRLDLGSDLLLQHLRTQKDKQRPRGSVLDFGCGIGVIGLSMLQRDPELDLTLLDNLAPALESARLSLEANSLQAKLLPSNGLAEVKQQYDWIVSNPPFHRGVTTNFDIARNFFAQSPAVLSKRGKMLIVSNRHLPYEGWLGEFFDRVIELECSKDFKILCASQSKT